MADLAYPRPQLRRDSFFTLDGEWTLNGQPIHVPYPPQAPLSGWKGSVPERLVYVRQFDLPEQFVNNTRRTLLHFGAVDQTAAVFLNGRQVCVHSGGYMPFVADITDMVLPAGNELRVEAEDRLLRCYPYGKQSRKPHGMWYTPVSGIWQSVWLEQVPDKYVFSLDMQTDRTGLTLTVQTNSKEYEAEVAIDGMPPLTVDVNTPVRLEIPEPRLWCPDDPFLYQMRIRFGEDEIESYFALRTVSVGKDRRGGAVIALNGQPVFLSGLLDQGYFPDGLFMPGDPAEYEHDILRAKVLGFNTLRKHIKVEPEGFYYACDRLGMLVIQDMVNSGPYSYFWDTLLPNLGFKHRPELPWGDRNRRDLFEKHCRDIQNRLAAHPCVIAYTIFNEGWGQYDTDRVYMKLKEHDPLHLYISASGWFQGHDTDIDSEHIYFRNTVLRRKNRPLLLSECGGYAYDARSDSRQDAYGYGKTASPEELTARIETLYREMVLPSIGHGLNGVIYTQLTDVETEINGLYTYDRTRCKVTAERLRTLNREADRQFRSML